MIQTKRHNIAGAAFAVLGVLTAVLGASTSAQAQNVYAISNTGNFGILNLNTGGYNNLTTYNYATQTGGSLLTGLAFASNSNVFAIDDTSGLYQIDTSFHTYGLTSQGQYTTIENSGQTVRSIAIDKSTGNLYGLASDKNATGTNATLFSLGYDGSTATFIKNLGVSSLGGLAILNSTAYATQGTAANSNGPVYQFSLTGAGGAVPINGQAVAGFANPVSGIAGVQGQLKAVDQGASSSNSGRTYNVSTTTGLASPQAIYDALTTGKFLAITDGGLAPEPGTLGLLAAGLTLGASGGGITARRRRSKNKPA